MIIIILTFLKNMQEINDLTFQKKYGNSKRPFVILTQNEELTRLLYYSKKLDKVELIINRNTALPESLVIKRQNGELTEYKNIESSIQLKNEDKELINDIIDRVITENKKNEFTTKNDPIIFSLQYLLVEGGYKNIFFDDADIRLAVKDKREKELIKKQARIIKQEENKKLRTRIEKIAKNRPENSIIFIPYVNFTGGTIFPHAITLIIQTDNNKNINEISFINSDENISDFGLEDIFPKKEFNIISNFPYQNHESCYLMVTQTVYYLQNKINEGKDLKTILTKFDEKYKFELIDIMRKNKAIMKLYPFISDFNKEDYQSFTTKNVKKKVKKLEENNQLNQKNVKKLLKNIILFSDIAKDNFDMKVKRLIKFRESLIKVKKENLFDKEIDILTDKNNGEKFVKNSKELDKLKSITSDLTKKIKSNFWNEEEDFELTI